MYANSHYKKFWLNKMEADEHDRKILVSGMFLRRNETLQECPSALDSLHDSSLRQISLASESNAAKEKGQGLKRLLHDGDLKRSDNSASELPDGAVSRACAVCKTEKTPLWRNGPGGPKSLCNACGIRYKKLGKRIEQQQISMSKIHKRKRNADRGSPADLRMIRRNVGRDEEEAAFLLMGLSCGLVNA